MVMFQDLNTQTMIPITCSSSSSTAQPSTSTSSNYHKPEEVYFDNFLIIQRISQAKFSVYLVASPGNEQLYAMKVYPRELNNQNFFYLNEVRFGIFNHPNVVSILGCQDNRHFFKKGEVLRFSYIIMEFAPYGDLFDLFIKNKDFFDEKLTRTYFHQLMDGLEFLHSHGVAHLDLKLENLLINENFQLKIADFDLSYMEGDEKIHAMGSKCYRAPEILYKTCVNPKPADIYSAGVILFMMQSQGVLPHLEGQNYKGVDLFQVLEKDPKLFWAKHCEFHREKAVLFTNNFRELFIGMTKTDPKERMTIKEIKNSNWYNGEIYSPEELIEKMREIV